MTPTEVEQEIENCALWATALDTIGRPAEAAAMIAEQQRLVLAWAAENLLTEGTA